MNINSISDIILDETSTGEALRGALDAFVLLCSELTGIRPDCSFDAWAEDSLLANGVAINPQAAAHCAVDYQRSVVFIRGIYAAINTLRQRFPGTALDILYAGCGPFGTLMLPLLVKFQPDDLNLHLLDFHQRSLDSLQLLLSRLGLADHSVEIIQGDACAYKHPGKLHLVVTETMQKSLEQEPQFAVTANLAPQLLSAGVFVPQRIDVALCLSDLAHEKRSFDTSSGGECNDLEREDTRQLLATVCTLSPELAFDQMQQAQAKPEPALAPTIVDIPRVPGIAQLVAALYTRICVFEQHCLKDYDSQITLPLLCHDLLPLVGGERYRVTYQLSSYPRFNFERLDCE